MEQTKSYKSFTELDVWQAARHFKNGIYELTKKLPDSEKYRLQDQLMRASRSIGANVAEGYGRFTYKDQLRFCMNARGSLFEVHNHLIDAHDCAYISVEVLNDYRERILNLEKLLNGYIAWLKRMSDAKQ